MSIWGEGDQLTLQVLNQLPIKGTWLDLAAGDGRYIPEILEKADKLIAADVDFSMLETIRNNVYGKNNHKLEIKVLDITRPFPLETAFFDGVFCTGTLHLFPKEELEKVFKEIDRVVKPRGMLIFDFAVDYQRLSANGELTQIKGDQNYSMKEAEDFLKEQFKNYNIKFYKSEWEDDLTKNPNFGYKTIGKYLLVVAEKK